MSDTNQNQSKQTLLITLIVLLVLFVGAQTWYMVGMKEQLNEMHPQLPSTVMPVNEAKADEQVIADNKVTVLAANDPSANAQDKQTVQPAPAPMQKQRRNIDPFFNDDFFNTPFDSRTWNPYEEIQRMQRDMDRMFNDAFSRFDNSPDFQQFFSNSFVTPKMDVSEDDDQYTVIVDLPGTDENDISVNLDGQVLTVKGEQRYEQRDKDAMGNVIFQERRSGSFQRSITLPEPVKSSGMKTQVENGVLTITIPKDKQ